MLRLTLVAAMLALIFMSSPFFTLGKLDAGAVPVYHH